MSNKTSDENVANIEELIQEYKTYNDLDGIQDLSIYINALENILAEREQDKKRIKELEELVAKFKTVDYMFRIDSYSNRYDMRRIYFEWLDSIPKQVVIDKIKEYDKKMEEDAGHPNWVAHFFC